MSHQVPCLAARIRPLAICGLLIGAVRYLLEFVAPESSMYFGAYIAMPIAYLAIGITGRWANIRWSQLAGTMLLVGLIAWGIWNAVAYTTGQLMGWTHGRFEPPGADGTRGRAFAIADTTTMKVALGIGQGFGTGVVGGIFSVVVGTLTIWLPGRLRHRNQS